MLCCVATVILSIFFLVPTAFIEVGGYNALITQYFEKMPSPSVTAYDSNNKSCSTPRADAMHMFR